MFSNQPRRRPRRLDAVALAAGIALAITMPASAAPRTGKPPIPRPSKVDPDKPTTGNARVSDADEAAVKRKGGKLFAVVMGPGPSWKKGQPLKKGGNDSHWRYWQGLHRTGVIESAGPVGKDTGFVLLHARSQKEANAVLAADPAIRAGQYRGVARPYDEALGD